MQDLSYVTAYHHSLRVLQYLLLLPKVLSAKNNNLWNNPTVKFHIFFSRNLQKKSDLVLLCLCLSPPPNRQSSSDHSRHFWVISRQKACHHFLVPSTRTEKILLHILTVSLEAAMLSGFVWQPQMAIHVWSVATNVRWRFVSAQLSNKFD